LSGKWTNRTIKNRWWNCEQTSTIKVKLKTGKKGTKNRADWQKVRIGVSYHFRRRKRRRRRRRWWSGHTATVSAHRQVSNVSGIIESKKSM